MHYLEVSAAPAWELISDVRRFTSVFCERIVPDELLSSRVALTVHELLENAVRYADGTDGYLRVELSPETQIVTVEVQNRASPFHIDRLRGVVDDLAAATDPAPYFQERMKKQSEDRTTAGLGLCRICVESEMTLSMSVVKGDSVRLIARGRTV
jgi:hypothetical protein